MSFGDIVALSAVEVFGDFTLRWYAQTNSPSYLGLGILGYVGVVFFLIKCLRTGNVLYVNGMWDSVSGVIESLAAYVVLGDRLEKPEQYLGLLLTSIGIYLLRRDGV
jgi:multidrug transporter EmrE-like cation transporter